MDPEAGEKPAAPRKARADDLDWTKENGGSLGVYAICMALLFLGTLRIAFFPAGRQRQQPLPALVSTVASDRGFSGPAGDYQATLEALKRVRRVRRAPRRVRCAAVGAWRVGAAAAGGVCTQTLAP